MSLLSTVTKTAKPLPPRIVMYAAEKFGKCLARGTPVLMHSGLVKSVEDIRTGDLLMGPDSKPRTVSRLHQGLGALYRVTQSDGTHYDVNGNHILSLRKDDKNGCAGGVVVNVSVREFMSWESEKQFHHRGYRVPVEWSCPKEQPIPPYLFGCWLGDGTSVKPDITTPDEEVVSAMSDYAESVGMRVVVGAERGKAKTYRMSRPNHGGGIPNEFVQSIKSLNVFGDKHIPDCYKFGTRDQRMQLLAGILDSDGERQNRRMNLTSASRRLAEDVMFLAFSLGFRANWREMWKTCTNAPGKPRRLYYQVGIAGRTEDIPMRISRRQDHNPRQFFKDVTTCRIMVEQIPDGEYFGFELDADHLFLLGDFTVTHNSSFASHSWNPVFLMTKGETGLIPLIESGRVPAVAHFPTDFQRWEDLKNAVGELRDGQHDYRTLVLDTGNGAEQLCTSAVCDDSFMGHWGDYVSYGRGDAMAAKEWVKFLDLLDSVRIKRRMAVIILHHAKVKTFSDPAGKSWDQWRPEAVEKLWSSTHKWADVILFGGFKTTVTKDEKATGESRYIRSDASGAVVAGNRYGLPTELTAKPGAENLWKVFADALAKARKPAEAPKSDAPATVAEPAKKKEGKPPTDQDVIDLCGRVAKHEGFPEVEVIGDICERFSAGDIGQMETQQLADAILVLSARLKAPKVVVNG